MSGRDVIPINYNYPISAWIYRLLSDASPEYAAFLHNQGYIGADGKTRKLFTFSRLHIRPPARRLGDRLIVDSIHEITLMLSSPMIQDFIQNIVIGLFKDQVLELGNDAKLAVQSVEVCPMPVLSSPLKCKSLSPIVVSTPIERNGKLGKHYLRPDEQNLSEAIQNSLVKKHQTAHRASPDDTAFKFEPDWDYIKRRGGPEKTMTLVRLKEGHRDYTGVKGFLIPFTLTGSIELMRTAWECGIGDQTSMGFGCIDVISDNKGSSKNLTRDR